MYTEDDNLFVIIQKEDKYILFVCKSSNDIVDIWKSDSEPDQKKMKLSIIRPEYNEIREEIFRIAPFIYKFVEKYNDEKKYTIRVIHRAVFVGKGATKNEALKHAVNLAIKELEDDIKEKRFVEVKKEEEEEEEEEATASGERNEHSTDENDDEGDEKRLFKILSSLNFPLAGSYDKVPYLYCNDKDCTLISLVDYGREFSGDSLNEVYGQIKENLEDIKREAYRKRESEEGEVISNHE